MWSFIFSIVYYFRRISYQLIITLSVVDIYVCCVSYTHAIAAKGFFLALVATNVETANPEAELRPGLDLLGPVLEKYDFCSVNLSFSTLPLL